MAATQWVFVFVFVFVSLYVLYFVYCVCALRRFVTVQMSATQCVCLPRPLHSHWALATPFVPPINQYLPSFLFSIWFLLTIKKPFHMPDIKLIFWCWHSIRMQDSFFPANFLFTICLLFLSSLVLSWKKTMMAQNISWEIWLLKIYPENELIAQNISQEMWLSRPPSLPPGYPASAGSRERARCPNYQIIFHRLDLLPGTPHPITG